MRLLVGASWKADSAVVSSRLLQKRYTDQAVFIGLSFKGAQGRWARYIDIFDNVLRGNTSARTADRRVIALGAPEGLYVVTTKQLNVCRKLVLRLNAKQSCVSCVPSEVVLFSVFQRVRAVSLGQLTGRVEVSTEQEEQVWEVLKQLRLVTTSRFCLVLTTELLSAVKSGGFV